jgi:hypothetical protein
MYMAINYKSFSETHSGEVILPLAFNPNDTSLNNLREFILTHAMNHNAINNPYIKINGQLTLDLVGMCDATWGDDFDSEKVVFRKQTMRLVFDREPM